MLVTRMFVTYIRTKLHMFSSSGSFVTAIRPNGNENFCTAAVLFYIQNSIL
jgi:hypothetical protein